MTEQTVRVQNAAYFKMSALISLPQGKSYFWQFIYLPVGALNVTFCALSQAITWFINVFEIHKWDS